MRCKKLFLLTTFALTCGITAGECAAQSAKFPTYQPTSEEPATNAVPVPADMNHRFPTAAAQPASQPASPIVSEKKPAFPVKQVAEASAAATRLTMNELGRLIQELQLTPKLVGSQYDVVYQAQMNDQEIEVFFSLKLTHDHSKIRIRA